METRVGDLLLLYHDSEPLGYARVEDITADVKPGWWLLSLLLLKLPMQHVAWILRDEYIDGAPFSMGGQMMRLERLPRPAVPRFFSDEDVSDPAAVKQTSTEKKDGSRENNVIVLRPRKKKAPPENDIA